MIISFANLHNISERAYSRVNGRDGTVVITDTICAVAQNGLQNFIYTSISDLDGNNIQVLADAAKVALL